MDGLAHATAIIQSNSWTPVNTSTPATGSKSRRTTEGNENSGSSEDLATEPYAEIHAEIAAEIENDRRDEARRRRMLNDEFTATQRQIGIAPSRTTSGEDIIPEDELRIRVQEAGAGLAAIDAAMGSELGGPQHTQQRQPLQTIAPSAPPRIGNMVVPTPTPGIPASLRLPLPNVPLTRQWIIDQAQRMVQQDREGALRWFHSQMQALNQREAQQRSQQEVQQPAPPSVRPPVANTAPPTPGIANIPSVTRTPLPNAPLTSQGIIQQYRRMAQEDKEGAIRWFNTQMEAFRRQQSQRRPQIPPQPASPRPESAAHLSGTPLPTLPSGRQTIQAQPQGPTQEDRERPTRPQIEVLGQQGAQQRIQQLAAPAPPPAGNPHTRHGETGDGDNAVMSGDAIDISSDDDIPMQVLAYQQATRQAQIQRQLTSPRLGSVADQAPGTSGTNPTLPMTLAQYQVLAQRQATRQGQIQRQLTPPRSVSVGNQIPGTLGTPDAALTPPPEEELHLQRIQQQQQDASQGLDVCQRPQQSQSGNMTRKEFRRMLTAHRRRQVQQSLESQGGDVGTKTPAEEQADLILQSSKAVEQKRTMMLSNLLNTNESGAEKRQTKTAASQNATDVHSADPDVPRTLQLSAALSVQNYRDASAVAQFPTHTQKSNEANQQGNVVQAADQNNQESAQNSSKPASQETNQVFQVSKHILSAQQRAAEHLQKTYGQRAAASIRAIQQVRGQPSQQTTLQPPPKRRKVARSSNSMSAQPTSLIAQSATPHVCPVVYEAIESVKDLLNEIWSNMADKYKLMCILTVQSMCGPADASVTPAKVHSVVSIAVTILDTQLDNVGHRTAIQLEAETQDEISRRMKLEALSLVLKNFAKSLEATVEMAASWNKLDLILKQGRALEEISKTS